MTEAPPAPRKRAVYKRHKKGKGGRWKIQDVNAWMSVAKIILGDEERCLNFKDIEPTKKGDKETKPYFLITLKEIVAGWEKSGCFYSAKHCRKFRVACLIGGRDLLFSRGLLGEKCDIREVKLSPPMRMS